MVPSEKGSSWTGPGLFIYKSVRPIKMYWVNCMVYELYLNKAVKVYKIKRGRREESRKTESRCPDSQEYAASLPHSMLEDVA